MSIDVLQEKIRKLKNPSMIDLTLPIGELPPHLVEAEGAAAYGSFCLTLIEKLKGIVPALRLSMTPFALVGAEGMQQLSDVLQAAAQAGYYVALEAPEILSPMMAAAVADGIFGGAGKYPCDGLIISAYPGTDVIKPFLPYCKDGKKDLFCIIRTSNKSAPELQDLMTGSRLVHTAAADLINRFGGDTTGKCGYARVAALAGGSSAESLRTLRGKYPKLFLMIDDIDYSGCNAKNCAAAFDKFGHGAVACMGPTVTVAWKLAGTDGQDYADQALAAAERMKKNLTRYTTIM